MGNGAYIELESKESLQAHLAKVGNLQRVVVQGLDLTGAFIEAALFAVSADEAHFLGCQLSTPVKEHIRKTGGTIFPVFEDLPFNPYRASLYTPDELMQGYEQGDRKSLGVTTDGQIYAHFSKHNQADGPIPVMVSLAYRIHDHAIDDALYDLLYPKEGEPKRVVGIMGGHKMRRDEEAYNKVARIAWHLAHRSYFVATGGGPGAMEAANLGAYMSTFAEADLEAAIQILAEQPKYTDTHYFERAYKVRDYYPDGWASMAIPTWFYGHEPSNLFGTHIAKYFANSLREDGLLAIAKHGVIYAPGSAGTIQEVFMDVAQNHYVTFGAVSPMVFLGTEFWQVEKPVMPLLNSLAEDKPYAQYLAVSDDIEEVVQFIVEHEPLSDPSAS